MLPLYDTLIGTSAIDNPLFDTFSKISVDTDIPDSLGCIRSIAVLEYALKPDWESVTFKFVAEFIVAVIILIPVFL